jgi:hypothetical protein
MHELRDGRHHLAHGRGGGIDMLELEILILVALMGALLPGMRLSPTSDS